MGDSLISAAAWCMGDETAETIISDTAILSTKAPFKSANSWLDSSPAASPVRRFARYRRPPTLTTPMQSVAPLQVERAAPSFTRWPGERLAGKAGEGEGFSFTSTSTAAELSSSPRSSRKPSLMSGEGEGLTRGIPSSTSLRSGEEDQQARSVSGRPSVRDANVGGGEEGEFHPTSRSSSFARGVHDHGAQAVEEEQMVESSTVAHHAGVSRSSSPRGAEEEAVTLAHHAAESPLELEQVSQEVHTTEDGREMFDC